MAASESPSGCRRIGALLAYGLAAALFTTLYFQQTKNPPGATLETLADLRGATPYQYRVLVPALAHVVNLVAPFPVSGICAAIIFGFTFGLFLVWRAYLYSFMGASADFWTILLLYPLIWNYTIVSEFCGIGDIPAIFFFVLGLVLTRLERWPYYYGAFLFACFNRETSCFLILAFVLLQWGRRPSRWIGLNVAAQTVIWLSVKALLTWVFRHNAGEHLSQNHWQGNLLFVQDALYNPADSIGWILFSFGWMVLLTGIGWRTLPPDFKRLLFLVGPFLLGMAVVGDFGQMRIHNELVPVLLAPAVWSLERLRCRFTKRVHGAVPNGVDQTIVGDT